jgi:hypothetical protein
MTRFSALRACAGVLAAALGASGHAYAHDPPEVSRIAWSSATQAVFQTQRGFIVGDTEKRSYQWACVAGLDVGLGEEPGFVLLPNNVWMVSTEHGLLTSADQGCTWNTVERFGSAVASALAIAPDAASHVFVTLAGAAVGGLYESRDAGKTWNKRLNLATDDYVAQIAIAPSQPARIYLSGLVIDEQTDTFSFQITRSSDSGTTWQRAYIPLAADEDHAVLAALSPVDPDTLVVLARNHRWGEAPDRALLSTDAGATYREIARGVKLTGAAFGATGKTLMLAGAESLSRIEVGDESTAAEPIGMSQMLSCAQAGPAGLYACGHVNIYDPTVYGASVSTDDGETWQSLMSFTEVKEKVGCTNEAVAKQCKDQWIDWQLEILVGLGGAPIDSVEGWRDFKGIEEVEHPAPAHTLASARRSTAMPPSGAAGSSVDTAAESSKDDTEPHADSGCQNARGDASQGYLWGFFALLWFGMQRVWRTRGYR